MDGRTNKQVGKPTDGRMDRRTDRWMNGISPLCSTGHCPVSGLLLCLYLASALKQGKGTNDLLMPLSDFFTLSSTNQTCCSSTISAFVKHDVFLSLLNHYFHVTHVFLSLLACRSSTHSWLLLCRFPLLLSSSSFSMNSLS